MRRSPVRLLLAISLAPMAPASKRLALGLRPGGHIDNLGAMQLGLPVVESDYPAIDAVTGEAATMESLDGVRSLANAVEAVRARPAFGSELPERGLARAAEFRWSRAGERYADLSRRVERSAGK